MAELRADKVSQHTRLYLSHCDPWSVRIAVRLRHLHINTLNMRASVLCCGSHTHTNGCEHVHVCTHLHSQACMCP
jgi:hypothetical protein